MDEYTPEQIAELQAKADKVDELEKFKTESEAKLQEYEAAKTELENYKTNIKPNWDKTHKLIENLKKVASDKGIVIDAEGNVVSNPNNVDMDKVRQEAAAAARGELFGNELGKFLDQYDTESAKVVKYYYDKLTQGENVTLQNMGNFIKQAEQLASSNPEKPLKKVTTYSGGQGPRVKKEGEVDQGRVEGLANLLGIKIKK